MNALTYRPELRPAAGRDGDTSSRVHVPTFLSPSLIRASRFLVADAFPSEGRRCCTNPRHNWMFRTLMSSAGTTALAAGYFCMRFAVASVTIPLHALILIRSSTDTTLAIDPKDASTNAPTRTMLDTTSPR